MKTSSVYKIIFAVTIFLCYENPHKNLLDKNSSEKFPDHDTVSQTEGGATKNPEWDGTECSVFFFWIVTKKFDLGLGIPKP